MAKLELEAVKPVGATYLLHIQGSRHGSPMQKGNLDFEYHNKVVMRMMKQKQKQNKQNMMMNSYIYSPKGVRKSKVIKTELCRGPQKDPIPGPYPKMPLFP